MLYFLHTDQQHSTNTPIPCPSSSSCQGFPVKPVLHIQKGKPTYVAQCCEPIGDTPVCFGFPCLASRLRIDQCIRQTGINCAEVPIPENTLYPAAQTQRDLEHAKKFHLPPAPISTSTSMYPPFPMSPYSWMGRSDGRTHAHSRTPISQTPTHMQQQCKAATASPKSPMLVMIMSA